MSASHPLDGGHDGLGGASASLLGVIEVVVVDDRGRIVVPRKVRDRLGIPKGSRLLMVQVVRTPLC